MNFTSLTPDERDVRITALLLGELTPAEADELRAQIAADPALAQTYEARKQTLELVGETMTGDAGIPAQAPKHLSSERRERLLTMFRTAPEQAPRRKRSLWFIPMTAAAGLIGLLVVVTLKRDNFTGRLAMARVERITRLPGEGESSDANGDSDRSRFLKRYSIDDPSGSSGRAGKDGREEMLSAPTVESASGRKSGTLSAPDDRYKVNDGDLDSLAAKVDSTGAAMVEQRLSLHYAAPQNSPVANSQSADTQAAIDASLRRTPLVANARGDALKPDSIVLPAADDSADLFGRASGNRSIVDFQQNKLSGGGGESKALGDLRGLGSAYQQLSRESFGVEVAPTPAAPAVPPSAVRGLGSVTVEDRVAQNVNGTAIPANNTTWAFSDFVGQSDFSGKERTAEKPTTPPAPFGNIALPSDLETPVSRSGGRAGEAGPTAPQGEVYSVNAVGYVNVAGLNSSVIANGDSDTLSRLSAAKDAPQSDPASLEKALKEETKNKAAAYNLDLAKAREYSEQLGSRDVNSKQVIAEIQDAWAEAPKPGSTPNSGRVTVSGGASGPNVLIGGSGLAATPTLRFQADQPSAPTGGAAASAPVQLGTTFKTETASDALQMFDEHRQSVTRQDAQQAPSAHDVRAVISQGQSVGGAGPANTPIVAGDKLSIQSQPGAPTRIGASSVSGSFYAGSGNFGGRGGERTVRPTIALPTKRVAVTEFSENESAPKSAQASDGATYAGVLVDERAGQKVGGEQLSRSATESSRRGEPVLNGRSDLSDLTVDQLLDVQQTKNDVEMKVAGGTDPMRESGERNLFRSQLLVTNGIAAPEPRLKSKGSALNAPAQQQAQAAASNRPMRAAPSFFSGGVIQPPATPVQPNTPAPAPVAAEPEAPKRPATPPPTPQPEVLTRDNAFSTFSLNVADVSFKLAATSLEKGAMPEVANIRAEEFLNAFDYRDPVPAPGAAIGFTWERAQFPFAQNRDALRFSVKTAAAGRDGGRPLNIVLLLDSSGSMERADRVRIIQEGLRTLATQLQAQDKISVVTFARTARLWVDGVSGTNAMEVARRVSEITPEGGTNLGEALDVAYATAQRHYAANAINRVVLLTDGAANLGDVEPANLKAKVETNRKQGIALDCFGVGWEGFNDDLLEQLSRNGDGRYGFLNSPEEAATEFAAQLTGALRVAASDVKVQVEFNPKRVNAYRQIGYAKHQLTKEQFRDNKVDAAEIGASEAGNGLYVIETNPRGEGPIATVRVRYRVPNTSDYREQEWTVPFTPTTAIEQSSPQMKLAVTSAEFAEWLASSPFASEVTTERLLQIFAGVPETFGIDPRPKRLEWMLRQAKAISGK